MSGGWRWARSLVRPRQSLGFRSSWARNLQQAVLRVTPNRVKRCAASPASAFQLAENYCQETGVTVEKLVPAKFRKNKIAMPRIFGCLRRNWISSTATDTTSTLAFSTLQASSFWRAL
jgi:hypothetical protein